MKKRIMALLLAVIMVFSVMPVVAAEDTAADLTIAAAADLLAFAAAVNAGDTYEGKTVKLTADIDLTNTEWTPISSFAGTFDGQNYTISNLTTGTTGLFTTVTGTIQNLKLDKVTADLASNVGYGFIAKTMSGNATNCHVSNVTINRAGYSNYGGGALFGSVTGNAVVDGCTATNVTVTHTGSDSVDGLGGVIGAINGNATVKKCSASNVTMNFEGKFKRVGGFTAGIAGTATVENCTLTGITLGSMDSNCYPQEVGGFVATVSSGSVDNCTVEDVTIESVRLSKQTGGFVGQVHGGSFDGCQAIDVTINVATRGSNETGSTAGFCGQTNSNTDKSFTNCSVTGLNMTLAGNLEATVGGFLTSAGGNGAVTISGCSVEGTVNVNETDGTGVVAGFLGDLGWGGSAAVAISESSADVDITTNTTEGAFVAMNASRSSTATATLTVTDCTATGDVGDTFYGSGETGSYENCEVVTTTTAPVAKIGETTYTSLADAFAAADTGDTITLLADVDLTGWTSVDVKKAITLDGNGMTITGLTAPLVNNASASLTIENLTISGANIEVKSAAGADNDTSAAALVQWANGGTLTLNNVSVKDSTITGDGYVAALVGFVDSTAAAVNVTGGTMSGDTLTAGGVVGTVAGMTYADVAIDGVTVTGNALTSTSDDGTRADKVGLVVGRVLQDATNISATVDNTNTATPGNGTVIGSITSGNAVITGGTYPVDPTVTGKDGQTASVKEGYEVQANANGTYGIVATTPATPAATITPLGNNLSLDAEIKLNQWVSISIEGYSQEYIEANGGLLVWTSDPGNTAEYGSEDERSDGLTASNKYGANGYYVQSGGIAAKEYADELWLRAYLRLEDGSYIYTAVREYSVQMYCKARLAKDSTGDADLKKEQDVCRAMLCYGSAAQTYFGYNVDDLADANIQ